MEEKIEALAANVEKLQKTFDWMIAQMVKKQEQGGKTVQGKNDDPFNSFRPRRVSSFRDSPAIRVLKPMCPHF